MGLGLGHVCVSVLTGAGCPLSLVCLQVIGSERAACIFARTEVTFLPDTKEESGSGENPRLKTTATQVSPGMKPAHYRADLLSCCTSVMEKMTERVRFASHGHAWPLE